MKKNKITLISLLLIASNSFAGWQLLGETGGSKAYIETSTFKKTLNIVDVSWLSDPAPYTYGGRRGRTQVTITSIRFDSQLDCANDRYRIIKRTSYSEHLAVNPVEAEFVNGNWQEVNNKSLWKMVMHSVC